MVFNKFIIPVLQNIFKAGNGNQPYSFFSQIIIDALQHFIRIGLVLQKIELDKCVKGRFRKICFSFFSKCFINFQSICTRFVHCFLIEFNAHSPHVIIFPDPQEFTLTTTDFKYFFPTKNKTLY